VRLSIQKHEVCKRETQIVLAARGDPREQILKELQRLSDCASRKLDRARMRQSCDWIVATSEAPTLSLLRQLRTERISIRTCPQGGRDFDSGNSGGAAFVAMVQPGDLPNRHGWTYFQRLH
jgi:hypothetical protein